MARSTVVQHFFLPTESWNELMVIKILLNNNNNNVYL